MSHKYEIEIKSLLGSKDRADKLKADLKSKVSDLKLVKTGYQKNYYYNPPADLTDLFKAISPLVAKNQVKNLEKIFKEGQNLSIRSKDDNGKIYFVVKSSVGNDTSDNGVARIEFDAPVSVSLEKLDQKILGIGLTHQAKWSREREKYQSSDLTVTIDKNAGYGYVAEFEKVIEDIKQAEKVKQELYQLMSKLEVEELPQDRLERMFGYYTENWPEYYGTDKIFIIN